MPFDGSAPLVCNSRINRIDLPSGEAKGANRNNYSDHVISMEGDCSAGLGQGDECAAILTITRFSKYGTVEPIDEAKHRGDVGCVATK